MEQGERAILHIDGDAFFAACEVSRNPGLRGKPVVTGRERGIVSAATYEAKALGIHRAMPIKRVMQEFPEVTVLPGDYDLYGMYAKRLYAIARRYAHCVEEYGIDECFADLTGQDAALGMSYEEIARRIKSDLFVELALSFSLGLASTKALAKLGSKFNKPNGFTYIRAGWEEPYLAETRIKDVWGIGRALSVQMDAQNIRTALDFTLRDPAWVQMKYTKPTTELLRELRGESVWPVEDGPPAAPHSVQRTRTFSPPTRTCDMLWSQLSRNVEEACRAARFDKLIPARASFFLKSQDFRYWSDDVRLAHPSDMPQDILHALRPAFLKAYEIGIRYRATGVTLFAFRREDDLQLDLWSARVESRGRKKVFEAMDRLALRYGAPVVSLASSFAAEAVSAASRFPHEDAYRARFHIPGTGLKHLPIPVLGEAR